LTLIQNAKFPSQRVHQTHNTRPEKTNIKYDSRGRIPVMTSRSVSYFVAMMLLAVTLLMLVQVPRAFASSSCGYLQTNRNPPYYYRGDTLYIYGGGWPSNRNFRVIIMGAGSGGSYGVFPVFVPTTVPSTSNGWISFSIGPFYWTGGSFGAPTGWFRVEVWCSDWIHVVAVNFYYGG
jgi:hypothetical protein